MKANSQRVKGKNFKYFNGKPLFKWTLDTLLSVKEIDRIIINTDAREILADNGVLETDRIIIRDRASEICGDMISMNLIIEDDVKSVDADIYLMTHTTNPLMKTSTVENALNAFLGNADADSLFTVNKIQTRFYKEDCTAVNHDPKNLARTQDLVPWFEENSNLYIFTKRSFTTTNARIGVKPMMFETSKFESLDIDTQEDWDFSVVAGSYLKKGERN